MRVPWLQRLQEMLAQSGKQRVFAGAIVAVFVGLCLFVFGAAAIRLATRWVFHLAKTVRQLVRPMTAG